MFELKTTMPNRNETKKNPTRKYSTKHYVVYIFASISMSLNCPFCVSYFKWFFTSFVFFIYWFLICSAQMVNVDVFINRQKTDENAKYFYSSVLRKKNANDQNRKEHQWERKDSEKEKERARKNASNALYSFIWNASLT